MSWSAPPPSSLTSNRSDWMLPGGSVFVTKPRKGPTGRSATQTLLEVESSFAASNPSGKSLSATTQRRNALQNKTASQRSRHTLRRMVADQLGRDILTEFRSQEFEVNPLCEEEPPSSSIPASSVDPSSRHSTTLLRSQPSHVVGATNRGSRTHPPAADRSVADFVGDGDDDDDSDADATSHPDEDADEWRASAEADAEGAATQMLHGVEDLVALKHHVAMADGDSSGALDMEEFVDAVAGVWPAHSRQALARLFMQVHASTAATLPSRHAPHTRPSRCTPLARHPGRRHHRSHASLPP